MAARTDLRPVFGAWSTKPAATCLATLWGSGGLSGMGLHLGTDCALLPLSVARPSVSMNASIANNCVVQKVDFGVRCVLSANVDAAGQLTVTVHVDPRGDPISCRRGAHPSLALRAISA